MKFANGPDLGTESIEVIENLGEWFVRVVHHGKAHIMTFEIESYARAFADGQATAMRLEKLASNTDGQPAKQSISSTEQSLAASALV
ncbi:MAG: hypothetical protein ABJB10_09095 [Mesorhizobium sp.]